MLQRQLGDLTVTRIVESELADFEPAFVYPETEPEEWEPHKAWLQPRAMDPVSEKLVMSIQSFLVRTRHHTILIDTCVGDHKKRDKPSWNMTTNGTFLTKLKAAGVQPEAVDFVLCTHMHVDHVGWNTRLRDGRWVPTFPNARYIFSRKELEHWQARHEEEPSEAFADSVLPIVEAGRALLVSNDHRLDDEVWLESTPGHSPDHVSVRLTSRGAQGVVTGDLVHSPVQCQEPTWIVSFDFDSQLAGKTRRAFLERYCETDTLVCGTHFPSPSFGHIVPRGEAFWFEYEETGE